MAANTPPEVQRVLQQLEPMLVRWYRERTIGEIAVLFGQKTMLPVERPKHEGDPVEFERADGRAQPLRGTR